MTMSGRQLVASSAMDSDDEEGTFALRDWTKVNQNMRKDGYRMGLDSGQEEQLQEGFNSGFHQALDMALAAGKLQGQMCGILAGRDHGSKPSSRPAEPSSCSSLMSSCSSLISQIPGFLMPGPALSTSRGPVMGEGSTAVPNNAESYSSSHQSPSPIPAAGNTRTDSLRPQAGNLESHVVSTCGATNESSRSSDASRDATSKVCENVCMNKSGFWSQLETFREQAQSLEFT